MDSEAIRTRRRGRATFGGIETKWGDSFDSTDSIATRMVPP